MLKWISYEEVVEPPGLTWNEEILRRMNEADTAKEDIDRKRLK